MFDPFSSFSLLAIYCLSVLLVLVSLGFGLLFGHLSGRDRVPGKDTSVGSAVAATLGLLAFMLAFTFNMTAERFNKRKALLLDEANAIETTYLRADFLSAGDRNRARALLTEYARLRNFDPSSISEQEFLSALKRSEEIHAELWEIVARLSDSGYSTEKLRAFYGPLNQVIDFHSSRLHIGTYYRVPPAIWSALYAITTLAMFGIGFQLGVSHSGSPQVAIALALAFSLVILLIADLDRTDQGLLLVDQRPMAELSQRLQRAESARTEIVP